MPEISLTLEARNAVQAVLRSGDLAIDATAGNGHDTLFLAEQVGEEGKVWAFDLQLDAIQKTQQRLASNNATNVECVHCNHALMAERISTSAHGRIAAVMFNLGYLPGGDKSLATKPESTTSAIHDALQLLRPGGILTVIAYTGHDGGGEEADQVGEFLNSLSPDEYEVQMRVLPEKVQPPRLFVVFRFV